LDCLSRREKRDYWPRFVPAMRAKLIAQFRGIAGST
jgi:hypothetical protein